jgi:surfactin synthase thioesterase subunit
VLPYCEPVLDAFRLADHVEAHLAQPVGIPVAKMLGELDLIISQDDVNAPVNNVSGISAAWTMSIEGPPVSHPSRG